MSKPFLAFMIALYATGITGLTLVSRAMANSMPAESSVVAPVSLPTYLETLRQASSFDSSAVGIAGTKSETYRAFEQAIAQGNQIRPEIEYLLQQGTPAGQLYAALLLLRLDPPFGEQALAQLRSDQVMVTRYSGCERITLSMAQVVADISHEQGLNLSIE
jgi:hypothetical protein